MPNGPAYAIDLPAIAAAAQANAEAHSHFVVTLKAMPATELDAMVMRLNATVEPQIDCLACGNCCKTLMINVEPEAIPRMAAALGMGEAEFCKNHVAKGSSGLSLMNAIPCAMLHQNRCTVYAARPEGCASFPHLHQPGISKRLFFVMNHYAICPIVYHVVEAMKQELGW
ncbi:MAG: YkgJ family cysteine cluster protein [Bacteroidetes bacterium]|nr:MAG: YkgJ family cysteine cluster protein [Bacteroidota bacterium]